MTTSLTSCAEFQAMLPDYLEAAALGASQRAAADAHLARCAECGALVNDLRTIMRDARDLPMLTPDRDLWDGIQNRIEAPVLAIAPRSLDGFAPVPERPLVAPAAAGARAPWRRLAIAASLLVAVTAGVTYTLTARSRVQSAVQDSTALGSADLGAIARPVTRLSGTETFDREIESLRKLVDSRRGDLDPVTVGIVEKNLKLIDQAIAESKVALANDPASAFLNDRLTHAYDSKLQLMRELASRFPRS